MQYYFIVLMLLAGVAVGDRADDILHSIRHKAKQLGEGKEYIRKDWCTAIAVGPKATVDGSTFTTHTDDNENGDFRVNKVPARDWPEGSMRPIRQFYSKYPRVVNEDRGFTWTKDNLEEGLNAEQKDEWLAQEGTRILGHIPQVAHTYALIEAQYGIMNEHQVAIGESTCGARFSAAPVGEAGGHALLEIMELTQLGLERGKTAREVIQIMGSLAEKYGYYGAEWNDHPNPLLGHNLVLGESGEGLTVVDPHEAWLFHMLPDPTGTTAIWAAQRVPDDGIGVIANSFVIRGIPENDPENFMYSKNVFELAEANGWWKRSSKHGELLDFNGIYGFQRFHDDLSSMRQWRIFSLANPSLNLPASSGGADSKYAQTGEPYEHIIYPATVRVDHKLSLNDIINYNSDHYEGTPYSTAVGLASGPYGDPTRYDPSPQFDVSLAEMLSGEYERPISIHRTLYSTVCQPRAHRPDAFSLLWFGVYAPDQTVYYPIYINTDQIAPSYTRGSMHKYDDHCAWWVVSAVGNYANRFYKYSMSAVRDVQQKLHFSFTEDIAKMEAEIMAKYADRKGRVELNDKIVEKLTAFTVSSGELITKTYRELLPLLFTKYRDGYVVEDLTKMDVMITIIGYPRYWLEATGFFKSVGVPGGSYVAASPISTDIAGAEGDSSGVGYMTLLFSVVLSFAVGAWTCKRFGKVNNDKQQLGNGAHTGRGGYKYSYVEIPNEKSPL